MQKTALYRFWEVEKHLLKNPTLSTLSYKDVKKKLFKTAADDGGYTLYLYLHAPAQKKLLATKILDFLQNRLHICLKNNPDDQRTFQSITNIIKHITGAEDSEDITRSYLTLWILNSLNAYHPASEKVIGRYIWISRYDIINYVVRLIENWAKGVKDVFNAPYAVEGDLFILIWTVVQSLIHLDILKAQTITTPKGTEILVRGRSFLIKNIKASWLGIYTHPSHIVEITKKLYSQRNHYSTINPIFKKNKNNNTHPEFIDIDYIKKKFGTRLYLRDDILKTIKNMYEKKYEVQLDTLAGVHTKLCELRKKKKTEPNGFYMELYKLQFFVILYNTKDVFKNGLYYDYFYDFRGRVYAQGPVSYTFEKSMRCCLSYGFYTTSELAILEKTNTRFIDEYYNYIIKVGALRVKYPCMAYEKNITKLYIFIIFFELGKLNKNKLSRLNCGEVSCNDFIVEGVDLFMRWDGNCENFEFACNVISLIALLNDLNNNVFPRVPVFKDATASVIQLLALVLHAVDKQLLKECNLFSNMFWYDTYLFFIRRFLNVFSTQIPEPISHFFTRENLKQTIMTINYGASLLTCWNSFCASINRPNNKDYFDNCILFYYFKLFYYFLQKLFDSTSLFKCSAKYLVVFIQNYTNHTYIFNTMDGYTVPLGYYKSQMVRLDREFFNKRSTIVIHRLTAELDIKKTKTALRANLIHSVDAFFVRRIEKRLGYSIMTIHDSFGVDILNVFNLIKLANEEFNNYARRNPIKGQSSGGADLIKIESFFIFL